MYEFWSKTKMTGGFCTAKTAMVTVATVDWGGISDTTL